ncbi:MAG: hypothetical protein V1753_10475 [Pseudomonadota bacterium]
MNRFYFYALLTISFCLVSPNVKIGQGFFCSAIASDLVADPSLKKTGIDKTVDPHGKQGLCHYCHVAMSPKQGRPEFRLGTEEATCLSCHEHRGATLDDYLRRMVPNVEFKEEMISYFVKHKDFSCHTCHQVMCLRNSGKNLQFRDPHVQLDSAGKVIESVCLFCHIVVPDHRTRASGNQAMRYDLAYVCSLCHMMSSKKTGLGFRSRMTEKMVRHKESFERTHDVSLPLGPDNTVICASCHNPHQAGVVLGKGSGKPHKHGHSLILEDPWELCIACHQGKY